MPLLHELVNLCKPMPLRSEEAQRLAVPRDDLGDDFRPDLQLRSYLLNFAAENPKMLLFGSRGCGKSTELSRLEHELGSRFLVVGLDVDKNQVQRDKLSPEELVLLSGLAVAKAATTVWGMDLTAELGSVEAAVRPLFPKDSSFQLDIPRLLRNLVLFGTTVLDPTGAGRTAVDLLLSTSESIRLDLEFGGLLRRTPDRMGAHAVLAAVNSLLEVVAERGGRPPLLLIDNLDKIDQADHAETLLTHESLLASLSCPVVLSGPNSLRQSSRLGGLEPSYQVSILYHVRCWSGEEPTSPDPVGMAKLGEMVDRRILRAMELAEESPGIDEVLSPVARAVIVGQSSGVVRDLMHLLEHAARNAIMAGRGRIEVEHANRAVARLRRRMELGLSAGGDRILSETATTRNLVGDAQSYRLLDDNFIVTYSNGSPWTFPHAALWGRLGLL